VCALDHTAAVALLDINVTPLFSQGTPMGEVGQMLESISSNRGLVNMRRSFTR
jgi:hypothetical protein